MDAGPPPVYPQSTRKIIALDAKMTSGTDRAREMALFVAVIDNGSFSAAGRILDLSPSAVARAIDRIEARLGVRLVERSTRRLSLTLEGRIYYERSQALLHDLDEVEQELTALIVDPAFQGQ